MTGARLAPETKVRHVRTEGGARLYREPIGAVIAGHPRDQHVLNQHGHRITSGTEVRTPTGQTATVRTVNPAKGTVFLVVHGGSKNRQLRRAHTLDLAAGAPGPTPEKPAKPERPPAPPRSVVVNQHGQEIRSGDVVRTPTGQTATVRTTNPSKGTVFLVVHGGSKNRQLRRAHTLELHGISSAGVPVVDKHGHGSRVGDTVRIPDGRSGTVAMLHRGTGDVTVIHDDGATSTHAASATETLDRAAAARVDDSGLRDQQARFVRTGATVRTPDGVGEVAAVDHREGTVDVQVGDDVVTHPARKVTVVPGEGQTLTPHDEQGRVLRAGDNVITPGGTGVITQIDADGTVHAEDPAGKHLTAPSSVSLYVTDAGQASRVDPESLDSLDEEALGNLYLELELDHDPAAEWVAAMLDSYSDRAAKKYAAWQAGQTGGDLGGDQLRPANKKPPEERARDEFENYLGSTFLSAFEATGGNLLSRAALIQNARAERNPAQHKPVPSGENLLRSAATVEKWGSEELHQYLNEHGGLLTWYEFRAQALGRDADNRKANLAKSKRRPFGGHRRSTP